MYSSIMLFGVKTVRQRTCQVLVNPQKVYLSDYHVVVLTSRGSVALPNSPAVGALFSVANPAIPHWVIEAFDELGLLSDAARSEYQSIRDALEEFKPWDWEADEFGKAIKLTDRQLKELAERAARYAKAKDDLRRFHLHAVSWGY